MVKKEPNAGVDELGIIKISCFCAAGKETA